MSEKLNAINKRYKEQYQKAESRSYWHGLVIGEKAIGKTKLIESMPGPVFVFSFDPSGMDTVRKSIESGHIMYNDYGDDDMQNPTAFKRFSADWSELATSGFLHQFGTVVFDSLTTMHIAAQWYICASQGHQIPMSGKMEPGKHGMLISDWGTILHYFVLYARKLNMLPCHTMMIGHISKERDEVTGALVKQLSLQGQSKDKVPFLTSEVYYMIRATQSNSELKVVKGDRVLLTEGEGDYHAGTRLGAGGLLPRLVKPDMREIFKTLGLKHEDKENPFK